MTILEIIKGSCSFEHQDYGQGFTVVKDQTVSRLMTHHSLHMLPINTLTQPLSKVCTLPTATCVVMVEPDYSFVLKADVKNMEMFATKVKPIIVCLM